MPLLKSIHPRPPLKGARMDGHRRGSMNTKKHGTMELTNNNTKRRFELKSYRRRTDKPDCPACGMSHRFSEYIDVLTGLPVGPGIGKCDRVNHCCYWLTPHEYFAANPEKRDNYFAETSTIKCEPVTEPQREFLPDINLAPYMVTFWRSNFGLWLSQIAPSAEALERVVKTFQLTASVTGAIVFWYIDENKRKCQGKMMWYGTDGHRRGGASSVSSEMAKRGLMKENVSMKQCLFGVQQIADRPIDTVYVVESEKTAIIMTMLHPEHIWLAAGGCSMLNRQTLSPLHDRRVMLIPDSGMYGKWSEAVRQSRLRFYHVSNMMEQYEANTDIADIVLGEARLKGEETHQG